MKETKCCKNYNGTLDITNSCIFCKTYLPKDFGKVKANNNEPLSSPSQEAICADCGAKFKMIKDAIKHSSEKEEQK